VDNGTGPLIADRVALAVDVRDVARDPKVTDRFEPLDQAVPDGVGDRHEPWRQTAGGARRAVRTPCYFQGSKRSSSASSKSCRGSGAGAPGRHQ
jgi:hypothetical protein